MSARLRGLVVGLAAVVMCGCAVPAVAQASFEVRPGSFTVTTSSDQAGAHADIVTSFAFTKKNGTGSVEGLLRNGEVVLPVGFAGYPVAVKTCSPEQLQDVRCPMDAQVGTLEIVLGLKEEPESRRFAVLLVPLFNITPTSTETAVYGFGVSGFISGYIVATLGPDYKVHASFKNVVSGDEIVRQRLTVWGVPADPSHDAQRGSDFFCQQTGGSEYFVEGPPGNEEPQYEQCRGGGNVANENPIPYLVNPTQCTGEPLEAKLVKVESWEGEKAEEASTKIGPFTGCAELKFPPTIAVVPEVSEVTSPTGYNVDLRVPQTEGAEGLGTADLEDAVVTLPEGAVLSPSAATGLVSCSEAEIGFEPDGKPNADPVECPNGSKLGEVSVVTPSLSGELKGGMYLGGPPSGVITKPPFTAYLTFAGHGVLVKIRGTVVPNPVTGQIVTTFDENPELPFSELKLLLNGGSRATVANPRACGEYHAESDFTPWTSPFEADVTQLSLPFEITGCQPARFDPSFSASTLSNQAGGYSTFRVFFSREDADEELGGLTVTTPPGFSGNLAKVPLCGEPQAAEGTCPESSRIGEVTAGAGPGPEPVFIKGGRVYLTGPYDGAPFGLSIAVSEKAGPLDLGTGVCDCEVIRATVNVNPVTAQLTVSNGALPTIKDGIPFQVKSVDVDINRPEFVFNPTNCEPMSINGTLSSVKDTLAQVSSHFQVTNCGALGFKPGFSVSTSGNTSRADGASLTARLTYPNVGAHSILAGGYANIAKVKVELPKQLPSRLSTLQKACTEAVFNANPAACPAASRIGYGRAVTPIFPVALTGPAFFVSNGGAKFPELVIVLQGDNVTIDLHGETFINSEGITSSTFASIPDVPVGSFELRLPEGPQSALAANGDFCDSKLVMPTYFLAQNGAEVKQNTPIAVTGCKPAITVKHHKVKGKKATFVVSVPSAGKLYASAAGLSNATMMAGKAGSVTLKLTLSSKEQTLLAHHHDRKLAAQVRLQFTPSHGNTLTSTVTVNLG
jgi:hypothetical protein